MHTRKLLGFTDNRQDAALQSGHFNDFLFVSLIRAAFLGALNAAGDDGLRSDELGVAQQRALGFDRAVPELRSEWLLEPSLRGFNLQEAESALRQVLSYRVWFDQRRGWRYTNPNLEQLGLVRVEYLGIDALASDEELFATAPEVLRFASPTVRKAVYLEVFDHLRKWMAIRCQILDPTVIDQMLQKSHSRLRAPWGFGNDEKPRKARWLLIAPPSRRDNDNLVLTEADPSSFDQTTGQAFDSLNRLVAITDALNGSSEYEYDKRDNLTSVMDERGLTTNYIYDGFDNLLLLDSPDTGITVYTYDKAGNEVSETDARGIQKTFTYDALNRVTLEHYPADDSEDITYHYDASGAGYGIGRLTSVEDATGTTSYTYDPRGNQLSSTVVLQGNTYTTQFAYDLADNLIQTVYPSGRVIDHARDALGRVEAITTRTSSSDPSVAVVNDVEYLPFGGVTHMTYGNELDTTVSYDQDYRITGIETVDGNNTNPDILDVDYTLDAVNNIEDIVNNLDASRSQVFEYDALNRLTGAGGIYGILQYEYDAVGNRLEESRTLGGTTVTNTYTYFPGSNSIESITDGTNFRFYQYDAAGNVRADGNNIYRYNQQNRLIEVVE